MARRTFSRLASTIPRSREPGAVRPSSKRRLAVSRRSKLARPARLGPLWHSREALFRTLQIELGCTAPGSRERGIVLASLDSVRRVMAARLARQPEP